mgnify:FL=1
MLNRLNKNNVVLHNQLFWGRAINTVFGMPDPVSLDAEKKLFQISEMLSNLVKSFFGVMSFLKWNRNST